MTIVRSLVLFVLAAVAEIGGAWLVWQGWRGGPRPVVDRRRCARARRLRVRRNLPTRRALRPHPRRLRGCLRRRLARLGVVVDKFQPDRYDYIGAALCLVGVAVIMYAPDPDPEHPRMPNPNKELITRLDTQVINNQDLEHIEQIYTPRLATVARRWITPFLQSFPDVHMTVVDQITEDDTVVGRFTAQAPTSAPGAGTRRPAAASPT